MYKCLIHLQQYINASNKTINLYFQAVTYYNGAKIGFFQGDVKTLMDDIKELKPTVFPSVPRLLNRVYDKVRKLILDAVNELYSLFLKFSALGLLQDIRNNFHS